MDIDVFFIKSYCSDQLQKCSQLRNTRNIILYGFENNTDIGIQVLPNAVMGVQLLMDAALRSGCRELLILDVEKETVSSSLQREEVSYLSFLAASRQVPCRQLAGQRESMADELRAELAKGGGKTAVVGFRKSSFEQDVMKRIPCETLRLGRDYECFVTEYSPAAMQTARISLSGYARPGVDPAGDSAFKREYSGGELPARAAAPAVPEITGQICLMSVEIAGIIMKLQMKYWGLLAALLTMLPVPGGGSRAHDGRHPRYAPGSGGRDRFECGCVRWPGDSAGRFCGAAGGGEARFRSRFGNDPGDFPQRTGAPSAEKHSPNPAAGGFCRDRFRDRDGGRAGAGRRVEPQSAAASPAGGYPKSEPLPELPVGIAAAGIAEFEGRYYLAGGVTSLEPLRVNRKIYVYDPALPRRAGRRMRERLSPVRGASCLS